MPKQKNNKTILKRIKVTGNGKILRRNQLAAGTHRHAKSKSALERHKRSSEFFKGESKRLRKILGVQYGT